MKRVLVTAGIIALIAGAVLLTNWLLREGGGEVTTESEFIYALTVSPEDNSSQLLKIDSTSRETLEKVELAGLAKRVRQGNYIYVSDGESVVVYDENLTELARDERTIVDFDVFRNYMYVLAENALDIVDFDDPSSPLLVSSLSFDKTGHDIVFRDNKLYILDNFMVPIYLYLVDVRDPEKPELFEFETGGVNVYLSAQDVTGRWCIVEGYGALSERGASLHVFGLTPPVKRIASFTLFEYCKARERVVEGVNLVVITDIAMVDHYLYIANLDFDVRGWWTPISIRKMNLDLVVVELKDSGTIRQRSRLRLEKGREYDWNVSPMLVRDGDLLYYGGTKGIWLIDVRNPARPSRLGLIATDHQVVSLALGIEQ